MLRLLPQGDQEDDERSKMIDAIGDILPKYNQWVRMRLEARHMGASGHSLRMPLVWVMRCIECLGQVFEYLSMLIHIHFLNHRT